MATKKTKVWPEAKKPKEQKVKPSKVLTVVGLLKKTWLELSTFWRPLAGITVVYALLYLLFVMGLSVTNNLQSQIDTSSSKLSQATSSIIESVSNTYSGAQSDATVLVQVLLFLIAALATVWALRKLQALKAVTIRDAYYQGPAQLVSVLLVSMVLVFTLLPALLGTSILGIVLQASGTAVEVIVVSLIALLLVFLSAYLFTMFWPSFYIASLPGTRPVQALKSALSVTKKRRLSIMRKLIALVAIVVIMVLVVLMPFGLLTPVLIPYIVYVVLFVVFMFTQVYLYELYRSLL